MQSRANILNLRTKIICCVLPSNKTVFRNYLCVHKIFGREINDWQNKHVKMSSFQLHFCANLLRQIKVHLVMKVHSFSPVFPLNKYLFIYPRASSFEMNHFYQRRLTFVGKMRQDIYLKALCPCVENNKSGYIRHHQETISHQSGEKYLQQQTKQCNNIETRLIRCCECILCEERKQKIGKFKISSLRDKIAEAVS